MGKEYKTLTDVPIGTEMIINKTSKSVKLVEIRYFPTRYKCDDGNYYYTHDVDIIDWFDEDDKSEPCSYHGKKLEINEFGDDDWPNSYFPPNDFDLPTSEEIEKSKKKDGI